jgi:hypothetical protein
MIVFYVNLENPVDRQDNGDISPLPPSPRLNSGILSNRQNKRPLLKKQITCAEQYYKSTPKLCHSASLEKFLSPASRLKSSYSLGNIPSYKQRYNDSFTTPGLSSVESIPELMEHETENSTADYGNLFSNLFEPISNYNRDLYTLRLFNKTLQISIFWIQESAQIVLKEGLCKKRLVADGKISFNVRLLLELLKPTRKKEVKSNA